jgi:hypothetical protein
MKTKKITRIEEIIELINNHASAPGFVFRGHANNRWKLRPTLYRNIQGLKIDENGHLERFKKYLIGRSQEVQNLSDNEIWALGQHYGLCTPLLDWSVSIAVALFFAFESDDKNITGKYRSLFILKAEEINRQFCRTLMNEIRNRKIDIIGEIPQEGFKEEWGGKIILDIMEAQRNHQFQHDGIHKVIYDLERERPRIFSPKRYGSDRVLAQRGVFSIARNRKSVSYQLEKLNMGSMLEKINIASSLRVEILKYLDAHNINYLTMYPDIQGASLYTNYKLKKFEKNEEMPDNTKLWL